MAKKFYFERNDLTPTFSLGGGIVLWLLLDRLHAPGWVYGASFTVVGLVVVVNLIVTIIYAWSDDHRALSASDIDRRLTALEKGR